MMAEDIKPNRLERAKQAIARLVDRLVNDKIGLIVFAGDAYTQIPITDDYPSVKMFLAGAGPDMVSKQGTAIGAAIELAARSFSGSFEIAWSRGSSWGWGGRPAALATRRHFAASIMSRRTIRPYCGDAKKRSSSGTRSSTPWEWP